MKILVVDDIQENLYMLAALLRGHGHQVACAADGAEALEKAARGEFGMIISDILMPRMDGFQLCRAIKKDAALKKAAFVFYTATYTDPADREFALRLGAESFIEKPTEPDDFIGIVTEVIKRCERGNLRASISPVQDETVYLQKYNERLIRKLEDTIIGLGRAAKRVKETEEKYQDLINNANDAVVFLEKTGHIGFVNPEFCKMLGYSVDEAKGRHFIELVHPDDRDMAVEDFRKRIAGEDVPRSYVLRALTKDGTTIYVDNSASPVRREGKITGVLSIARDITERKRVEDELKRSQERLFRSQRLEAVGHLAAGVAHDFNNLLTTIGAYAEFIEEGLDPKDPMREDAQGIQEATDRAALLTKQLLAFGRKQVLQPRVANLNSIISAMEGLLRRTIPESVAISTVLCPELGPVTVDPSQMEQVILNLAVNARDAMPQGGKLIIETSNAVLAEPVSYAEFTLAPGSYAMIAVTDTGEGMDDDTVSRIFEPFFTTKEMGKGTGLGLASVFGIIKQSGGYISTYSVPKQGTSFRIYLPQTDRPAETASPEPTSVEACKGSETVLLAEDEPGVRRTSARILHNCGYRVLTACDGEEALRVAGQHKGPLHLLLTDVVMPNMDGLELARRLVSSRPDIKVLFMSGYTTEALVQREILNKNSAFLPKPFEPRVLALEVRRVLDKS